MRCFFESGEAIAYLTKLQMKQIGFIVDKNEDANTYKVPTMKFLACCFVILSVTVNHAKPTDSASLPSYCGLSK